MYRGRFAPSPTGDLHLGSAASALVAWLAARQAGGSFVLRIEDIDTPRVRQGCEERQIHDLRWLGIDWDEGPDVGGAHWPYRQSERTDHYLDALERLRERRLVYPCDCSRAELAELARVASAPHPGDEGAVYPGICRDRPSGRELKRPAAERLRVPAIHVSLVDRWQGWVVQELDRAVGDFVLRRGDGVFSYQLAVIVDDVAMGVSEVVRGADLVDSAPRQIHLARLLDGEPPSYAHHPLIVAADGGRLAKRAGGFSIADHRAVGISPERVVGALAQGLGLLADPGRPIAITPRELLAVADLTRLSHQRTVTMDPRRVGHPSL